MEIVQIKSDTTIILATKYANIMNDKSRLFYSSAILRSMHTLFFSSILRLNSN